MANTFGHENACPTQTDLAGYLAGDLENEAIDSIADHVEGCLRCQKTLAALEVRPDPFVACLSADADPTPFTDERECQLAMQQVQQIADNSYHLSSRSRSHAEPLSAGIRPPTQLGGYELIEKLGEGGMGAVYKARDGELNRIVALKMLSSDRWMSESAIARFREEAALAARLEHPNIVPIHEVGEQDGHRYFTMKLVDGPTLAERLEQFTANPTATARLMVTIAQTVHFAHQHGVLHRDLKPGNVLLDEKGNPHVSDFGLAKRLDQDSDLTQTGTIMGTPSYMAPEQARGQRQSVTTATDVYGLGAILYSMLTGRPPFQADTPVETCRQVIDCDLTPPSKLNPRIDRDLDTVCLKCLEKQPAQRYGSAHALAEDLQRWLSNRSILARRASSRERLWRWCQRRPALATLSAAVLLLSIFIAIGSPLAAIWWRDERDKALAARAEARHNEQTAIENEHRAKHALFDSYLGQARAGQWSGRPGQRIVGLRALGKAAELLPELELGGDEALQLRNQAIACLALADLRQARACPIARSDVSVSPDCRRYAASDEQGNIDIRRLADGQTMLRLPGFGVESLRQVFSPQGDLLAAVYPTDDASQWCRCLWDLDRREVLLKWSCKDGGRAVFSADGRFLAVPEQNTVQIFDTQQLDNPARIPSTSIDAHPYFHPAGQTLLLTDDRTPAVQVYDFEEGKITNTYRLPTAPSYLTGDAAGDLIAVGCKDGRIFVLDANDGKRIATLKGHSSLVSRVAVHPLGTLVVSTSWDGTTRLWHPYSGQELLKMEGDFRTLTPDGNQLAVRNIAASEVQLVLWDVILPREFLQLCMSGRTGNRPWDVATGCAGRLVACADGKRVSIWNLCNGRWAGSLPVPGAFAACFAQDPAAVMVAGQDGVSRWPIELDEQRQQVAVGPPQRLSGRLTSSPASCAMSADGWYLATIGRDGNVLLLNLEAQTQRIFDAGGGGFSVTLSPDGRWLAASVMASPSRHRVRIWNPATGDQICDLPLEAGRLIVKFSPAGDWLVTSTSQEYRFWEVGSWKSQRSLPRDGGLAGPFAFSPDARLIAVASSRYLVKIFEADTLREVATLESPEPRPDITAISFASDLSRLVVADQNGTVQVWNLHQIQAHLSSICLDWDVATPASENDPGQQAELAVKVILDAGAR